MTDSTFGILLIDDDIIDVENIRRAFASSERPHPLWTAHDGLRGLEMLEKGEVDTDSLVILLDLNMPRMNGIEFLTKLRQSPDHSRLPVVVLTTSDAERDRVNAYELNVAGYIVKPVTYDAFVEAMAKVEAYWSLQEFP